MAKERRKPEDPGSMAWASSEGFRRGIDLLNRGHYFDAHEVLEDVWRESIGEARQFLQGLIQVAVAMHHHHTGNEEGARSVLARAAQNLEPYSPSFGGLDVLALRAAVAEWLSRSAAGHCDPAAIHVRAVGPSR